MTKEGDLSRLSLQSENSQFLSRLSLQIRILSFGGFLEAKGVLDWIDRVDEYFKYVDVEPSEQTFLVARKFKG